MFIAIENFVSGKHRPTGIPLCNQNRANRVQKQPKTRTGIHFT